MRLRPSDDWRTSLLAAYERLANDDDAQILPVHIRDVLGDDCPRPNERTMERYKEGVLALYRELATSLGSDNVFLFKGELLNTVRVAQQLLESSRQPHFRTFYRRKFEAMTGIDCSKFYVERIFQPMSAAAIVEAFLESADSVKYKPGVRYFFGHRIPD
jgi:hypothetical protein